MSGRRRQSEDGSRKTANALTLPLVPAVLPIADFRLPIEDARELKAHRGRYDLAIAEAVSTGLKRTQGIFAHAGRRPA